MFGSGWLSIVFRAVTFAPVIVAEVERIAKGASGSSKKQMALEALGVAGAVAGAVAPDYKPLVDSVSSAVSGIIDAAVADANSSGAFQHSTPAPAAADAPTPAAPSAPAAAAPAPAPAAA